MHIKIFVIGVIVIAAIVFGLIFWNQLSINQKQLAAPKIYTTSTPPAGASDPASLSSESTVDALATDLKSTDLEFDANSSQIQTEATGL